MSAQRRPRFVDDGLEDEEEVPSVGDPETGEIRLLEDRCTTCVLNPAATAAPLRPGRRKEFLNDARAKGQVVCHSTLPPRRTGRHARSHVQGVR
ncbi:hypothetical protein [Streptomyces sp. bgisy154]|uniref:hypothetical protein n=1 Tax=Streptomyces sp. bgisy154 TaxID=3413794 RepID=UPI003D75F64D